MPREPLEIESVEARLPPIETKQHKPKPLREWLAQVLADEVGTTGAVEPLIVLVHADRLVGVGVSTFPSMTPAELTGAWSDLARRPAVLRSFRFGLLQGSDGVWGCVLERAPNGRWWLARCRIGDRSAEQAAQELEGPGTDQEVDEMVRPWLDGFDARTHAVTLIPLADGPLVPTHELMSQGFRLDPPVPTDLDSIATWLDSGLPVSMPALVKGAMMNPPLMLVVRDDLLEMWTLRRPPPSAPPVRKNLPKPGVVFDLSDRMRRDSVDNLVRNVSALGGPPGIAVAMWRTSTLFRGAQVTSVRCVIESAGARLVRHLPLVQGHRVPNPWIDPVRYPVAEGDGWIGVKPATDMGFSMGRGPYGPTGDT